MPRFTVAAFYQFCALPEYEALRDIIHDLCTKWSIKGIILLASEGINGTIAGSDESIQNLLSAIHKLSKKFQFSPKFSYTNEMPFLRMKVRLKAEIVTLGIPGLEPHVKMGTLVDPVDWNRLIQDNEVTVIDVRNDFEVRLGSFERAINPKTRSFGEFPSFIENSLQSSKDQKIALFCTGGIRCEKASAYLLEQGFTEVYQLNGGILRYLEVIEPEQSKWNGDCFVFDKRVAVGYGVKPADVELCFGCLSPLTREDRDHPQYEKGVCCSHCASIHTTKQKASARERKYQCELARKRNERHLGPKISYIQGTGLEWNTNEK